MYSDGVYVTKNIGEARKWYEKAADQGDAEGWYYLGSIYETGNGVLKNPARALEYYRKSTESGDPDAQYKVGMNYKDANKLTEAFPWFEKAATGGSANFSLLVVQANKRVASTQSPPSRR